MCSNKCYIPLSKGFSAIHLMGNETLSYISFQ
uniref:Uncharacterized protein n=1 Tax=Anguilla anguilla TaxID=7936 RepID=A0A0E9RDL7_ANGAN